MFRGYVRGMGDPARKLMPSDDLDLSPPLDPPLSADEKARILRALYEADVPEDFRESFRRDVERV